MGHETALRTNMAKVYVLISASEACPERMELASAKMAEIISILDGSAPLPQVQEILEKRAG